MSHIIIIFIILLLGSYSLTHSLGVGQ